MSETDTRPMTVHPYPPEGTPPHAVDCDWHMTHDGFDCTCWEDQ